MPAPQQHTWDVTPGSVRWLHAPTVHAWGWVLTWMQIHTRWCMSCRTPAHQQTRTLIAGSEMSQPLSVRSVGSASATTAVPRCVSSRPPPHPTSSTCWQPSAPATAPTRLYRCTDSGGENIPNRGHTLDVLACHNKLGCIYVVCVYMRCVCYPQSTKALSFFLITHHRAPPLPGPPVGLVTLVTCTARLHCTVGIKPSAVVRGSQGRAVGSLTVSRTISPRLATSRLSAT